MASAVECTDYCNEFLLSPLGGNASTWVNEAEGRHWPISETPVVGSIACYQPGQDGAEWTGHVAWVIAVNGDVYTVSEMNRTGKSPNEVIVGGGSEGGPGIVDTRQITFVQGVGRFIVPPTSAVTNSLATLLGGNASGVALTSADTGMTLSGAGAGLQSAVKTDAKDSWGWIKAQAVPLAVTAVVLFVLFGNRGAKR